MSRPVFTDDMSLTDRLKLHFEWVNNTEEGRKEFDDYWNKIAHKKGINKNWILKFETLSEEDKNILVDKCVNKYSSDEYYDRWYKRGIEPPTPLLFLMYEYASEYMPEVDCNEEDYMFCTGKYQLTSKYIIRRLDGQGSVIIIDKL